MARITKVDLDRYFALAAEATELGRRARALQAEMRGIADSAAADLESSGKPAVTRGGYRIDWSVSKHSIAWKNEFIARLGAEVAAELQDSAEDKRAVRITPPATE